MDIFDFALDYGIAGLAFVMHIPVYKFIWDKRLLLDSIPKLEKKVASVHDECLIQPDTITLLRRDVEQLKTENKVFAVKTENFEASIKSIDSKLDKLIEFHMV